MRLLGCCDAGCCISWYTVHSAAEVAAAEVAAAGVLPEGCWMFGAGMLGVLALSKEGVLGVDLCAVECLVRCVFDKYSKLAGVRLLPELLVWFLLLGTGVLLLIKAAGVTVNLVAL